MVDTQIRLLGPLEVVVGGVSRHYAPMQLVVLATMLLHPNQLVTSERLAAMLWDAKAPARSAAALQNHVMRLRRCLGDVATIRTRAGGYRLEVDTELVDLQRFRTVLDRAVVRSGAGDAVAEIDDLDAALRLWRGTPLGNVRSERLRRDEVPPLVELWLGAVERRVDLAVALGRHAEVLPDLWTFTAAYPTRERFRGQLMDALVLNGRPVEAIETYHDVRRELARELGLDPSAELQGRHAELLRGDAADAVRDRVRAVVTRSRPTRPTAVVPSVRSHGSAGVVAGEQGPPPTLGASAPYPTGAGDEHLGCHLPPDIRDLLGRDTLLERVGTELGRLGESGQAGAVAVWGPPGIGKTALAVRVAHRMRESFPDGQLFVSLRSPAGERREPDSVLAELLQILGVEVDRVPAETSFRASVYRSAVAGRRLLVVLDDAEDDEQVRWLVPGTAGSAALVTSRRSMLGLTASHGWRTFRLEPLEPSASKSLLDGIAGPGRVPATAADRLVALCSGLPLALRVVGAHLGARSDQAVGEYVDGLLTVEDPMVGLEIGRDACSSVRAAFDASYTRLGHDLQRAFRLLGLLRQVKFDVPLAAAVLDRTPAVARQLLDDLAAHSLLDQGDDDRYRFHDLLHRYARARITVDERPAERFAATERTVCYYLRRVDEAVRVLFPHYRAPLPEAPTVAAGSTLAGADEATDWLRAEQHNVLELVRRLALRPDLPSPCPLAGALVDWFGATGRSDDCLSAGRLGLGVARERGDTGAEAAIWHALAARHRDCGRQRTAAREYRRALAAYRVAHDDRGVAAVLADAEVLHVVGARPGVRPGVRPDVRVLGRAVT